MFGIVLFRIWHFVSAKKCIYVALSGLILAKNFATRQNNYNSTLTHQSGPFPCCYTLVVRVYTIYIFLFLGMLNMTIQTYAKSHMSDGVATKDTRVYKSLTRAYNDISLIPNQIPDENLLAPNQIIT